MHSLPMPRNLPLSFEQALSDGFCIAGPSGAVRETLKRQVVEAGVNYVMCHIAFGDLPLAACLGTIAAMKSMIVRGAESLSSSAAMK
jgi:hypothetical protein